MDGLCDTLQDVYDMIPCDNVATDVLKDIVVKMAYPGIPD